jgi:hypothetical protein
MPAAIETAVNAMPTAASKLLRTKNASSRQVRFVKGSFHTAWMNRRIWESRSSEITMTRSLFPKCSCTRTPEPPTSSLPIFTVFTR